MCHIDKLVSIRGIANSIIGLCQFVKYNYPDDVKRDLVIKLTNKMVGMYAENKSATGIGLSPFLPTIMPYCHLPYSTLTKLQATNDYHTIAFEAMAFLESKVFGDGCVKPYW